MTDAYPLSWPPGWPRTPTDRRERPYRFGSTRMSDGQYRRELPTFARSRDRLVAELDRLGAGGVVVSTNHPTDRYGVPRESKRRVHDDGVAVYFTFLGKPMVMACDRFDDAAGNMTSLSLAIEAMRQLDRHGGGQMMERAFAGFAALPASGPDCWTVLRVSRAASVDDIEKAWRDLAKSKHPDTGGTHAAMSELNAARDEALRQCRERAA